MSLSHFYIQPGGHVKGVCHVPGDKSISHRSVMLGAIADGTTHVEGFLNSLDCLATVNAFKKLGIQIEGPFDGQIIIHGKGKHGLSEPKEPIDVGNSGTSMRLLAGLLAGQSFSSEIVGDESLMKRPMGRVVTPLRQTGAKIDCTEQGFAPIVIKGGQPLSGIQYHPPIASAQIKSCLLLAGLYASGEMLITEVGVTRDHTERMLTSFGYPITKAERSVGLIGQGELTAADIVVPGDISSAAFFLVAACITPGASLLIKNVGINPTRIGVIHILKEMGADLKLTNRRLFGDEPVADISVKHSPLQGIEIPLEHVSSAIDEFPALFIAAACAEGRTFLKGAKELRVKESDRIAAMVEGLIAIGIGAETLEDGAIIDSGEIRGGVVDSYGDHRIAMAFAIAGLKAKKQITVTGCNNVKTSFPDFVETCQKVGIEITES